MSFESTPLATSRGPQLMFLRAVLAIAPGTNSTRARAVTAVIHRQPIALELSVARLRAGRHTLTATVSYRETVRTRRRTTFRAVTKFLVTTVSIC